MLLMILAIIYILVKTATDHQQRRHHLMLDVGNQFKVIFFDLLALRHKDKPIFFDLLALSLGIMSFDMQP